MRVLTRPFGLTLLSSVLLTLAPLQAQAANCKYLSENANPVAQYQACPDSLVAAYQAALYQYQRGNQTEARNIFNRHGGVKAGEPLNRLEALFSTTDPYQTVANIAQQRLKEWRSSFRPIPFYDTPPKKPERPPLPKLIKDEFETTVQFKARVEKARQERQQQVTKIENDYAAAVRSYNRRLQANQDVNQQALEAHKAQTKQKKLEYLEAAYTQVFGKPYLKDARYNADEGRFYARLLAIHGGFDQQVTINVPLSHAKQFKQKLSQIQPVVTFNAEDNQLKVEDIQVTFSGNQYAVNLSSDYYKNEQIAVTLQEDTSLSFDTVALLEAEPVATELSQEEIAFFDGALQLENDPELAKLLQEQAEAARKEKELLLEQQRRKRLAAARAQLAQKQAEIAKLSQGTVFGLSTKAKQLMAQLPKASLVNRHDIAVIIGNRNYASHNVSIPNVDYALNDAQVMRRYARQTLGIPDSNIFYLEDASQSELVSIFGTEINYKGRLFSRVRPNQSKVFIFYSGHGVPGLNDQRGYLLPVDADPSTVELNGYALETLYSNLEQIPAKHVDILLDACFSGSSQSGNSDSVLLVKNASPALLKVKSHRMPANASVFTATTGSQVASWDTGVRLGLFTHFVLQGLTGKAELNGDNRITGNELARFLRQELPLQARRIYNREQTPMFEGDKKVVLASW